MGIKDFFSRIFGKNAIKKLSKALDDQLLSAAAGGDLLKVNVLLKAGANINARNSEGYTVLMNAGLYGHDKVAKTLIDAGADLYAVDNYGRSELNYATDDIQDYMKERMRAKGGSKDDENRGRVIILSALSDMRWNDETISKLELTRENRKLTLIFHDGMDKGTTYSIIYGGYLSHIKTSSNSVLPVEIKDDSLKLILFDAMSPDLFKFNGTEIFVFGGNTEGHEIVNIIGFEPIIKKQFPEVLDSLAGVFRNHSSVKDLGIAYSHLDSKFKNKYSSFGG